MKTYTFKFDLASPSPARFQTLPWSDFAVGIQILSNGAPSSASFILQKDGQALQPEASKTADFTIYNLKSEAPKVAELRVVVDGVAQPFTLVWETISSTLFETGNGGSGAPSKVEEEWKKEQYDTRVMYQDTANRNYVLSSFTFEGEVTREDIPTPDGFPVCQIIFGTGVSAVGDDTCSDMAGLQYVYLPKTVKRIGDRAFMGSFLARLDWDQEQGILDASGPAGSANEGQLSIGLSAFAGCENLGQLNLPYSNKLRIEPDAVKGCNFEIKQLNTVFVSNPGIHFMGYFWQAADPAYGDLYNLSGATNADPDWDTPATVGYVQGQQFQKSLTPSEEGFTFRVRRSTFRFEGGKYYCAHATQAQFPANSISCYADFTSWYIRPASLQTCYIDLSVDAGITYPHPVQFMNTGTTVISADVLLGLDGKAITQEQLNTLFSEPGTRRIWSVTEYALNRAKVKLEGEVVGSPIA